MFDIFLSTVGAPSRSDRAHDHIVLLVWQKVMRERWDERRSDGMCSEKKRYLSVLIDINSVATCSG